MTAGANALLSVMVRFHATERMSELRRCLLSLFAQSYAPLEIVLLTQGFNRAQSARIQEVVADLAYLNDAVRVHIQNVANPNGADLRSKLLNTGLDLARGRYVAFLDYDDYIFNCAYQLLVAQLRSNPRAAIACGYILYRQILDCDSFQVGLTARSAFRGKQVEDLLKENFLPIHSYVIDRERVPFALRFREDLAVLEDHDFLLQLAGRVEFDLSRLDTPIGIYVIQPDRRSTNLLGGSFNTPKLEIWLRSRRAIEPTRREAMARLDPSWRFWKRLWRGGKALSGKPAQA